LKWGGILGSSCSGIPAGCNRIGVGMRFGPLSQWGEESVRVITRRRRKLVVGLQRPDSGARVDQEREMIMEATERGDSEKHELRAKLEAATEKAKEVCKRLQDQTVAAAKAADKVVHEHPYPAIGIAFGVGLLIGMLATRCRRD